MTNATPHARCGLHQPSPAFACLCQPLPAAIHAEEGLTLAFIFHIMTIAKRQHTQKKSTGKVSASYLKVSITEKLDCVGL